MHLMAHNTSLPSRAAFPLAKPRVARHCSVRTRVATPVVASPTTTASPPEQQQKEEAPFKLVCPICLQEHFSLPGMPSRSESLNCRRCSRSFDSSPSYVDLTLTSGLKPKVYNRREWGGTELFRSPLVSFVYERGWRQGFAWAGFPGEEKEFEMAMKYLEPVARNKVLVDMSCGSGLFSRRFARSGKFAGVIAADFSETMLQQARSFFQEDGTMSRNPSDPSSSGAPPILLLRADVGRLPFPTGSVAAIHAGAAIHCWPNPQAALAEISRVLAPGGIFVGTTFMVPSAPLGQVLGDDLVRPLNQLDAPAINNQYRWWEEAELRDLCTGVGLQDFARDRSWRFIMFSARKPT
mmetsp:Transcript_5371/g.14464  ORF Transcript_5371/g.14464 Transcript_5371/m.14464 type:complete len:351 (-) Transcript_5371:679-1731(-)|eukprot:CAMPEP_0202365280 /NCGR_PEP_ID=MMETSP1126-20121109/16341_1 /ASSEMBLY_ACC=CAM_ASM_000457 /TAXON_ID=3047 /ORGANISM="Dunaliella tertiolecta, Strain CCMP1320" /LENGTH=350 /DNA_ID=CAMNT_0048960071 /DNA_START=32 /DNA_END=1084 /DNA_ORIENTATION=-